MMTAIYVVHISGRMGRQTYQMGATAASNDKTLSSRWGPFAATNRDQISGRAESRQGPEGVSVCLEDERIGCQAADFQNASIDEDDEPESVCRCEDAVDRV